MFSCKVKKRGQLGEEEMRKMRGLLSHRVKIESLLSGVWTQQRHCLQLHGPCGGAPSVGLAHTYAHREAALKRDHSLMCAVTQGSFERPLRPGRSCSFVKIVKESSLCLLYCGDAKSSQSTDTFKLLLDNSYSCLATYLSLYYSI